MIRSFSKSKNKIVIAFVLIKAISIVITITAHPVSLMKIVFIFKNSAITHNKIRIIGFSIKIGFLLEFVNTLYYKLLDKIKEQIIFSSNSLSIYCAKTKKVFSKFKFKDKKYTKLKIRMNSYK